MTDRPPARGVRLSLGGRDHSGPVDGAWWPRSRDLVTEAVDLVEHFPPTAGRVRRLLFSRPDWDAPSGTGRSHSIAAGGGTVRLGSFASDDTHLMVVTLDSGQRLRLLVVPHDTEPARAQVVLGRAADGDNVRSAGALLGLSGPDQSEIGAEVWDSEHHGPHGT